MADFSPNKRLELPKSNEKYDVGVANKNNMVIDSELHKLELKNQSQDKLLATKEELNSAISSTTTKLDAEISRAKSSENELSNSIENEIDRAVTTEMDIVNELDNRLPLTGGTITSINQQMLNLRYAGEKGDAIIQLFPNNFPNKRIAVQSSYSETEGTSFKVFRIEEEVIRQLLQLSGTTKKVFDPKTNGLKEILVDGDAASLLKILRTTSNANYKPGVNAFDAKEFSSSSENIPTQDFYHIITMQGQDVREEYVTQLAVGMTKDAMYYRRMDHDAWGEWKKVILSGDPITPTVKQTEFKIKNRDLSITGVIGNTETDITDIIIKAYSGSSSSEGMRVGISPSNGMGYIQAQNFKIDCNLLSLEETRLLQTFYSIRFTKANDSDDYPRLMPSTHNFAAEMYFTNKDGTKLVTTKVQILSDSSRNYFYYDLPKDFKYDTASGNNLMLESKEWLVATGIDVKNRG